MPIWIMFLVNFSLLSTSVELFQKLFVGIGLQSPGKSLHLFARVNLNKLGKFNSSLSKS